MSTFDSIPIRDRRGRPMVAGDFRVGQTFTIEISNGVAVATPIHRPSRGWRKHIRRVKSGKSK